MIKTVFVLMLVFGFSNGDVSTDHKKFDNPIECMQKLQETKMIVDLDNNIPAAFMQCIPMRFKVENPT